MEKNTSELILEEILKMKTILDFHTQKFDVLEKRINDLEINIEEGFSSLRDAINYIGNKVFDNHEYRIQKLEGKIT